MDQVDPITVEIIRSQLLSIPNQIDGNIMRTAYSPLVYEFKDYAVGLVDPEGRLIAQSKGGIPIFIANALGIAVADGLAVHGRDGIHPGDVIISNHAATLGQHLNNVVMYTPVHAGDDLVAFMAVLVHWLDIGGIVPGSCLSNDTTDIYQEGIQYRSVKLWSRGERVDDMYRMIEVNTRFPAMVLGDLDAQLAACLKGAAMTGALYARYGAETVRAAVVRMWDQSEAAARKAIAAMPDGEYQATAFLDNDGQTLDRPVSLDVLVRVAGDEMTVDFSHVADQVSGPINSGRDGGAVTAARVAFKYLTNPDEPANDGSFRPLNVEIPDGKFLSAAADAPMGAYSAPLPSVIDVILRAMAPAVPGRTAAGHHATFCAHAFFGRHPDTGELFNHLEGGLGGCGRDQRRRRRRHLQDDGPWRYAGCPR